MKDLIAKLKSDATCAMGALWIHMDSREAHIDAQAARIAELEAQQAFGIGETYANALSRIAELEAQIAGASAPVVDPVAPLRNLTAWQELRADVLHGLDGLDNDQTNIVLGAIDYYMPDAASTALQAPVREVPGWVSVKDRLPDMHTEVMVWPHPSDECMTAEVRGDGTWYYSEYTAHHGWDSVMLAVGRVTHWMPLPAAPVQEPKP